MNHRMSNPLRSHQSKRNDRKRNLKEFGSAPLRTHRLHAPLRRRPRSQRANAPDHIQVDQRAGQRRDHHRNTNRIAVKAMRRRVDTIRRRTQRTQTNSDPNTADRNHRRARTLQDDKHQTRHAHEPGPLAYRLFRRSGRTIPGTTRFKGHLCTNLSPHRILVEQRRYFAACSAKFPINGSL